MTTSLSDTSYLTKPLERAKDLAKSKSSDQNANGDLLARAGIVAADAQKDLIEVYGMVTGEKIDKDLGAVEKISSKFETHTQTSLLFGADRFLRRAGTLTKLALFTLYSGALVAGTHYILNAQHNTLPLLQEQLVNLCSNYTTGNFTGHL